MYARRSSRHSLPYVAVALLASCNTVNAADQAFHLVLDQLRSVCGTLAPDLADQQKDQAKLAQSLKLCLSIEKHIVALSGQIDQQLRFQRQAELLPGTTFNPTQLNLFNAKREECRKALQQAQREHKNLDFAFALRYATLAERFGTFLAQYQTACGLVRTLDVEELKEVHSILANRVFNEQAYAEAVLFAIVTIRLGADLTPAVHALKSHAATVKTSNALGFSAVGVDRLTLSILCGSDEDVGELVRLFRTERSVRDEAATTYMLACYHASKDDFKSALRYATSTHRKLKTGDSRNRLCAAADALFYAWVVHRDEPTEEREAFSTEVKKIQPPANGTGDMAVDWQVARAQIVIAKLDGDDLRCDKLIDQYRSYLPPLAQSSLTHVVDGLK